MDGLKAALQRGAGAFSTFTQAQKAVAVLGVLALVVGGVFFSRWASTPTYAPLFSNLAPADASAIVEKLNAAGTPYELANGGATVMVPRESVYDVRVQLSGEGLPAGETTGFSLLDKQGITASEFRQRVDYQRALQGELANTVKAIDGIETAVINLAIPEKDVFADEDGKTTASVLVKTSMGTELTSPQVRGIVHLVASSVEGLAPEDVTVTDSTGKVLSGSSVSGAVGAGDERAQQIQAFEQRMSSSLQAMLDKVVGSGNSVVQLTADLDYDATKTQSETYNATPGVPPLSEQTSEEVYEGAGGQMVGGVLGPDNIAVPADGADGAGNYTKREATRNPAVNRVVEERKSAPGTVRRLNVAVLLNTTTAGDVDPAVINDLVSSSIGIDPQRGDTIEVQRLPFDETAQAEAEAQLQAAADAEEQARLMSLVKTGALALIIVVVAWLSNRKKKKNAEDKVSVELELVEEERRALEEARERLALEHAENMRAIENLSVSPPEDDAASRMRDEIGDLVENQPDEVAQLLRGWLADRRT